MTLAEDATSSGGAVWELCPGTGKAGAMLWADPWRCTIYSGLMQRHMHALACSRRCTASAQHRQSQKEQ
jgi:hypothetical protein